MSEDEQEAANRATRPFSRPFFSNILTAVLVLAFAPAPAGTGFAISDSVIVDTRVDATSVAVAGPVAVATLDSRWFCGNSGSRDSWLARLDTRGSRMTRLVVSGPETLPGASCTQYSATIQYSDGSSEDVTGLCSWSVAGGPPGTMVDGGRLDGGYTATAVLATITARLLRHDGQLTSEGFSVLIGPALNVRISSASAAAGASAGGGQRIYGLLAGLTTDGAVSPLQVTWKWNGAVIASGSSPTLSQDVVSSDGTGKIEAAVTDSVGKTGWALASLVLGKPPVPGERLPQIVATDGGPATLYNADGSGGFSFGGGSPDHGFAVIIHGLQDSITNSVWMTNMAAEITAQLHGETPSLLLYDWRESADPSRFVSDAARGAAEEALARDLPVLGWIYENAANEFEGPVKAVLLDFATIRPFAIRQGVILADWIRSNIISGNIEANAPIHLIGHSAGGFVAGECGRLLMGLSGGLRPSQLVVTMLDTPFAKKNHVTGIMNPGRVERYISSPFGACSPSLALLNDQAVTTIWLQSETAKSTPVMILGYRVEPDEFYRVDDISGSMVKSGWVDLHNEAHDWYIKTVMNPGWYENGFYYSPFLGHSWDEPYYVGRFGAVAAPMAVGAAAAAASEPVDGFSSFGDVTVSGASYDLIEGEGNAGIYQEVEFGWDASMLRFTVQFTSPGDGDFVEVHFGDGLPLEVVPDLGLTRDAPFPVEIDLSPYAGETGTLLIRLTSRGSANAVARISDITIESDPDLDRDGLTADQELALGTHPRMRDSDMDGLADNDEISGGTSPTNADTDGDGLNDGGERAAGTDPLDGRSKLAVQGLAVQGGTATIRWPGVPGRSYRVERSNDPSFRSFEIIASGIAGVAPVTQHVDTTLDSGATKMFYRVVLEP